VFIVDIKEEIIKQALRNIISNLERLKNKGKKTLKKCFHEFISKFSVTASITILVLLATSFKFVDV